MGERAARVAFVVGGLVIWRESVGCLGQWMLVGVMVVVVIGVVLWGILREIVAVR